MNRKLVQNYGAVNELSFTIPYTMTGKQGEPKKNPVVDQIYGDFLVRYEDSLKTDYYVIANPEYSMDTDGNETLSLICYQQQYELKNKLVRAFQGTSRLYDPIGSDGVLNQTLLRQTDWKIGYIDSSLLTKYRTFDESNERPLLEFVFTAIDAYGSYVPLFNTEEKTISIYLEQNYGTDNGLRIEHGKYLKSLKETDNFDDVATRVYVSGDEDLSINSKNPTGAPYIENFSFYTHGYEEDANGTVIGHSKFMSDSLCHALKVYDKLVQTKSLVFSDLLSQKAAKLAETIVKDNELFTLQNQMAILLDDKDLLIGTSGNVTSKNAQIAAKQIEIDNKKVEIQNIKNTISNIDNQIAQLRNQLSAESNFTPAQIREKSLFIKEKSWSDTHYTDISELYAQAEENLQLWSQPAIAYTCDIVDLISALNIKYDKDKLKIGSIISIYYPRFSIDIKAKIITMTHDIDGNGLSITIANTRDIKSEFLKMKDLFNRSASTSTTVDMSKYKWDKAEDNTNDIQLILDSKWDANKNAIEGGSGQQYILNERGLTISSPSDPMRFLRAVNSVIAITNDGGQTYKNALTSEGLVAEMIFGVLVAGNNFYFTNESGSFMFDKNGARIDGAKLTFTNGGLPESQLNPASTNKWNSAESNAKAYADQQVTVVLGAVDNLDTYINGAFEDGIIEQSEAMAIAKYINSLGVEKAELDSKYTGIYTNVSLTGTAKTNLATAKTAYDSSHITLINSINAAIADGKTTVIERNDVDNKFSDYRTKLGTLSTRFEEATNAIIQAKADAAQTSAISAAATDATTKSNAATAVANAAQTSANAANSNLADIANDNKLTPTEKQSTKLEWDIIFSEKANIEAQATTYSIVTEKTTYTNAYNSLNTYITPLLASLTTTSDIVGTTFRSTFKTYFDARTALLKAVSDKAKLIADAAQSAANDAQAAATSAQTSATNAVTTANSANTLLADIASDNKFTASEKQAAKLEWDTIVSEKANIEAQGTLYSITTEKTTYTNAYTALSTYITPLLVNLTVTSDIVGTTFRSTFKSYYDAKTALLKVVADKAKAYAENDAQTKATAAETAAKNASVLKGASYNSVVIDSNGVVVTHGSGNYTKMSAAGLIREIAGVGKPYHYLTHVGSSETGSSGNYYSGGSSASSNGDPAQITNRTITLPPDFQGKDFTISLSYQGTDPSAYASSDGKSFYVPYYVGGTELNVVSKNITNGTFVVQGYGFYYYLSSPAMYKKYHAIKFGYTVVV